MSQKRISKRSVTLRLWVMPNAGFATRQVLEREIREFHRSHPGVSVELTVHPWFRAWDLLIDVAKGRQPEGPDVVQVGTTWVSTLAFLGLLSPLPEGGRAFGTNPFLPRSWDSCRPLGGQTIYAVPWYLDIRVLYYRKDILKNAGVSESSLEDWRGFAAACKRLVDLKRRSNGGDVYPLCVSSQKPGVQIHDMAPWIWASGGDFLNPLENVSCFATPETVRGLSFFYSLVADGAVPLLGRDAMIPMGNIFRGDYAMQFCGVWPVGTALEPSHPDYRAEVAKNLGVTFFPIGPKGRATFIGGSNLAVSARSRYSEEAWALVKFLSTRESQVRHSLAISALPARKDGWDDVFAKHQEARSVFMGSLDFARPLHSVVLMGSIERAFWYFGERVLKLIQDSSFDSLALNAEVERTDQEIKTIISFYSTGEVRAIK